MASGRSRKPNKDVQKARQAALRDIGRGKSIREATRGREGVGREWLSREVTQRGLGKPEARTPYKAKISLREARERKAHERMNKAVGDIEQGMSQRQVAKKWHVGRQQVSTRLEELELVSRVHVPGKKREIIAAAKREMTTYSEYDIKVLHLSHGEASRNSYYLHTVYKAMQGDPSAQESLRAMTDENGDPEGVTDIYGVFHPWELDLAKLREMTMGGNIPEIYRLV